jgi:hypothetical protein
VALMAITRWFGGQNWTWFQWMINSSLSMFLLWVVHEEVQYLYLVRTLTNNWCWRTHFFNSSLHVHDVDVSFIKNICMLFVEHDSHFTKLCSLWSNSQYLRQSKTKGAPSDSHPSSHG